MSIKLKAKNIIFIILSDIIFLFSSMTAFALRWSRRSYPMQSPRTVYFVLHSDISGHDSNTALSILKGFIIPALILYAFYRIVLLILHKNGKRIGVKTLFVSVCGYFAVVLVFAVVLLKVWMYPIFSYEVNKKPVESEFYAKNYIDPADVKITPPETNRNLVLIFMESMESTYASVEDGGVFAENLIPELTRLAKENVNFSGSEAVGGGYNLEGTSWTAAGLISKMAAVPYFSPFKNIDGRVTCLPQAVAITDILKEQGYTEIFSIGSEKKFENRDAFLENHGMQIHDINWYKQNGYIPQDYNVFWGFEDKKLFEIVKTELDELGKSGKTFCYGMLTVDTHFPYGYKCPDCPNVYEHQMMNVLRCADNKISGLVNWIQQQPWYDNTVIVIIGDHCYLNAPKNNFIAENSNYYTESKRRFLNIIINPAVNISEDVQKNRQFSSYDIMPTVLECMGYKIEGGSIALGRSLLNGCKTLIEEYGEETVNSETMKRTVQYERLK